MGFIETYASPDIEVLAYVEPVPDDAAERDDLIEHIEALMGTFKQKQSKQEFIVNGLKFSSRIY